VKKCDCNFSVKIKVLNFKKKFSGHFFKFSEVHEFKKMFKIHKIRILDPCLNPTFSVKNISHGGVLGRLAATHLSCGGSSKN